MVDAAHSAYNIHMVSLELFGALNVEFSSVKKLNSCDSMMPITLDHNFEVNISIDGHANNT